MKHIMRITAACAMLFFATAATGQIKILTGLGLAFGTGAETVGLQIKGDVDITDTWGGSLDFIPFFTSGYNYWEMNLNGHYTVYENDPWTIYPLAGLNLSTVGIAGSNVFGVSIPGANSTKVGLNLGGGARYAIADRIVLYGEIKYIVSSFDQLVISLGGLYTFSL